MKVFIIKAKRLTIKILFLICVLNMFLGCASFMEGYNSAPTTTTEKSFQQKEEETMNSWLRSHKSELIRAWGPPERTTSDGKDGEILIYEQTINFPEPYGPMTRMRMFYVQQNGIIYDWLCKGRSGY